MRKQVIELHNHNPETIRIWQHIVDESRKHYQPIYDILEVDLHQKNERGESFYAEKGNVRAKLVLGDVSVRDLALAWDAGEDDAASGADA